MQALTVFRSTSTCRAMALTDRPWRCKSKIMTSSPSLITASSLPPAGGTSAIRRTRPPFRACPEWRAVTKTGEISNVTSDENCSATHTSGRVLLLDHANGSKSTLAEDLGYAFGARAGRDATLVSESRRQWVLSVRRDGSTTVVLRSRVAYVAENRKVEGFFETASIARNIYLGLAKFPKGRTLLSKCEANAVGSEWIARLKVRAIGDETSVV